jgi:hypothetical protein
MLQPGQGFAFHSKQFVEDYIRGFCRCQGMDCKSFMTSNMIRVNFELAAVESYGLKWNSAHLVHKNVMMQ